LRRRTVFYAALGVLFLLAVWTVILRSIPRRRSGILLMILQEAVGNAIQTAALSSAMVLN